MVVNHGAALPVKSQERWYRQEEPRRGKPVDAVLLADVFFGQWLHWVHLSPQRAVTVPCMKPKHCLWCEQGSGSRWKGFIAAMLTRSRDFVVLQLTQHAAGQLLPFVEQYGSLRGLQFVFKRGEDKVNGKVHVRFVSQVRPEVVPKEFPIHCSLARLWGVNEEAIRRGGQYPHCPHPASAYTPPPPSEPPEAYVPTPEEDEPRRPGNDGAREQPPARLSAAEVLNRLRSMRGVNQ